MCAPLYSTEILQSESENLNLRPFTAKYGEQAVWIDVPALFVHVARQWVKITCQEVGHHPFHTSQAQPEDGWRSLCPRRNGPVLHDAGVRRKIQSVKSKSHLANSVCETAGVLAIQTCFALVIFGVFLSRTGRKINLYRNTQSVLLSSVSSVFRCIFILCMCFLSMFRTM